MKTISAKELRLNLKEILDRVNEGEEFTVIYKSKPIAQLSKVKQDDKFDFEALDSVVNEIRKQYKPDPKDAGKSFKQLYHEHLDEKYGNQQTSE